MGHGPARVERGLAGGIGTGTYRHFPYEKQTQRVAHVGSLDRRGFHGS
jgi:hypothetical protein